MPRSSRPKARIFWPVLATVVVLDFWSKAMVVASLGIAHAPRYVFGDVLRLTLAYNPGAAFSISLGAASRWIFATLAILVLAVLGIFYRATSGGDRWRAMALGLVCGGAIGNLLDRLRSDLGVVDFIDIGWGDVRFYTFNVADMAVTAGALLLAVLLWREEESGQPDAIPHGSAS